MTKFVAYLRVSTTKQGASGLGIEAQRSSVAAIVGNGVLLAEYVEVESGRKTDRPALARALQHAKATNATLICAKLDRIGRRAAHVLSLLDDAKKAGLAVIFADNPNAGALTLGVLAVVAEEEARAISARTVAALAAAKARGQKLGGPNGAAPLLAYVAEHGNGVAIQGAMRCADDFAEGLRFAVDAILASGAATLVEIAAGLNSQGFMSRRGGEWYASSVSLLLRRLGVDRLQHG